MKEVAFDKLYKQFVPMIQSIISELHIKDHAYYHHLGMIALWEAQQRFTSDEPSTFGAYVYVKVRGAMLDEFRRNSRYTDRIAILERLPEITIPPYSMDTMALVDSVLQHVSAADATLFRLVYVNEFTLAEVSVLLGEAYTTVSRRHARLMRKLQALKPRFVQ